MDTLKYAWSAMLTQEHTTYGAGKTLTPNILSPMQVFLPS